MVRPATFTERLSGRSRLPEHASHTWLDMYFSIHMRMSSDFVSLYRRSRLGRTPSKGRVNRNSLSFLFTSNFSFRSPEPFSIISCISGARSFHGVRASKWKFFSSALICSIYQ